MLGIVQRHHDAPFYLGDVVEDRDVLDILKGLGVTYIVQATLQKRGAKDPSVYIKVNVEGPRAVVDAAIAAGVCRLVYTSSASVMFNGTDIVEVDGRTSYLHKLFDTYNLLPYHSTTSNESKLDPESVAATLHKFLHRTLPPICATTEYHRTTQTLSPYVTPAPNAESILSVFSTPFDPHKVEHPVNCFRVEGQAFFVAVGGLGRILDVTGMYDEYERRLSHLKVQSTYEQLGEGTRVRRMVEWFAGNRWSFEATEVIRRRRGLVDLRAEKNRYLRRTATAIQGSTRDFKQRTHGHTVK